MIEDFLRDLDRAWRWPNETKIALRLIGSAALMLQTPYRRGTKDSDVLETAAINSAVRARLLDIAGPNSTLFMRRRIYVDIVGNGLPSLPQRPSFHPLSALNATLRHFAVEVLDVADVVVKLKRLHANDLGDIAAMIDGDLVTHARVLARFRDAFDYFVSDSRATDLPRYIANLHRIERDHFSSNHLTSSFRTGSTTDRLEIRRDGSRTISGRGHTQDHPTRGPDG